MSGGKPDVRWDKVDGIGILSLDNPPGNTLPDPEFMSPGELRHLVDADAVRGLVITGCGRHFSSGADEAALFEMARDPGFLASRISAGRALLDSIAELPVPVAAAIRGVCFGGGLEIALAAHFRFCGEKSLFAFPEVNLNLIPGLNGPYRLSELVGRSAAVDMMLSGDAVDADKALALGLVDRIIPGKDVRGAALDYLKGLTADRPPELIRALMTSVNNARRLPMREAMEAESRLFCELAVSEQRRRTGGGEAG